jgi:hypothetical protein
MIKNIIISFLKLGTAKHIMIHQKIITFAVLVFITRRAIIKIFQRRHILFAGDRVKLELNKESLRFVLYQVDQLWVPKLETLFSNQEKELPQKCFPVYIRTFTSLKFDNILGAVLLYELNRLGNKNLELRCLTFLVDQ